MTDNLSAEDRIRKVRISFLRENPFFANISLYLNLIETRNMPMPTMGIDYEGNLYFDPDYVKSLTFSELKGVIAHETCLVPETFIWNKKINEIKTSDKILGDDGKEHKVILANERKYKGELICITPRGSLPIKITPNHPILTTKGSWKGFCTPNYRKLPNRIGENKFIFDKFEWKMAKDITLNDWLVIPKIKPLKKYENYTIKFEFGNAWSTTLKKSIKEGLKLDEDIAYFLGLYTADGWANLKSKNIGICLHSEKDKEKTTKVKGIIERKMGFKVQVKKRSDSNCVNVIFSSRPFTSFLHKNIGTRAWNKKIPEFILFGNDEIKKSYLRGFIDGDGYNNKIAIGFATISENLAHQLFILSASLGIIFNMYKERRNAKKALSHLNKINKEWSDIYIFFSRCHKIYDVLNLPHIERTIRKTKFFKEYKDYILIRIRKIKKKKYNGMVYNLQTENQNYTANNIIVHNCHLALFHLLRKGSRDKELWNCSADLSINQILQEQEFRLPRGVLLSDEFQGLCAEEIYDKLYRTAKKIKIHIDSQGNVTIGNMSGKQFDTHYYPKKGENGNDGSGKKDKDYKGKGEEDSPLSEGEIKRLQDEWKKRVVEASTLAKSMGSMPAGLERMIGTLLEPKINWKALLYRYVTNEIISDTSYCIDKNSRIKTGERANNYIRIKNIQPNQKILGYKDNKIIENKVIKVFEKTIKNKYIIYTKSAKKLMCSGEHRILTENGYKRVDNLKIGDKILSIKHDDIGTYERTEMNRNQTRLKNLKNPIKRCEKCGRLRNDYHRCPTKKEMRELAKNNLKNPKSIEKMRQIKLKLYREGEIIPYWKGKKRDPELIKKMNKKKKWLFQRGLLKTNQKGICYNTGRTHFKKGQTVGEKNNNWKGGITPLKMKIRQSEKYKNWRNEVFERDRYICQKCNKKNTELNAHHIKTTYKYPNLIFDKDNGITLCENCHLEYHKKEGFR